MDEIVSKVTKIISEQLGKDESEINLESHFIDDLDADSLDTVELVMALEEEFGIDIPDDAPTGDTEEGASPISGAEAAPGGDENA